MTKIAVLSDIHGNREALMAVLMEARHHDVSHLFICGDITGYYYDTASVWSLLKEWNRTICHGNHETILSRWIQGDAAQKEKIRKRYGSSYQRTVETMPHSDLEALLSLPHPVSTHIDSIRFLLSHGTPWDEEAYLYPDMNDESRHKLEEYSCDYDVIFMGHTHYQMNFPQGQLQIINPGSVGQPRSGKESLSVDATRAQWALYNTQDRSCALMTSLYDPAPIFKQVDMFDPDLSYLKTVLKRQEVAA